VEVGPAGVEEETSESVVAEVVGADRIEAKARRVGEKTKTKTHTLVGNHQATSWKNGQGRALEKKKGN